MEAGNQLSPLSRPPPTLGQTACPNMRPTCCLCCAACVSLAVREDAAAKEDERAELWQADWDDEETTEDFQAKLRQELDRHMKD